MKLRLPIEWFEINISQDGQEIGAMNPELTTIPNRLPCPIRSGKIVFHTYEDIHEYVNEAERLKEWVRLHQFDAQKEDV